jgi:hypothetical protein
MKERKDLVPALDTIGDLMKRASRRGVSTPILSAALCNLQAYEINRSNPR